MLMMQLRLLAGLDLAAFQARAGTDLLKSCAGAVQEMRAQKLLETAGGHLRLTRNGLLVADAVITELAAALDDGPNESLPVVRTKPGRTEP